MNVHVTSGAEEYVVARVTEKNGRDLEPATITVGLGTKDAPPADWQAPDDLDVTGAQATVSLLIDSPDQIGTFQYLWVKVVDTPEVIVLRAESNSFINVS